ncbi:MAG: hypothetical protein KF811_07260 [Dokdonella sp.]|nr:hypothetical protein [Dokdonella sp.]
MARACIENVTFIALACDQQPHFTTLAHFVATLGKEVEAVFRDVLMVCNAQGLIGKAMFAIDGCKLPSKNRVCPNCSRRQTAGSRLHTTRCNTRRRWVWPPRRNRADRPRILTSMAPPSSAFHLLLPSESPNPKGVCRLLDPSCLQPGNRACPGCCRLLVIAPSRIPLSYKRRGLPRLACMRARADRLWTSTSLSRPRRDNSSDWSSMYQPIKNSRGQYRPLR